MKNVSKALRVKFLAILVVLAIIIPFASCNQSNSANDITKDFRVAPTEDGKSLIITRYMGDKQSVNIPANLHGMSVTEIGNGVFNGKELIAITIPNSITKIGEAAFNNNLLTKVTIPNNVTEIGDNAFANNRLITLSIGNNVTTIGDNAFANNRLTSLTISNKVTAIGESAFRNNNLTSVSIGNAVTSIGPMTFKGNEITDFRIHTNNPEFTVKDLFILNKDETQLISYVGNAENLTIPQGITTIGEWAIARCQINSVTIPNSVSLIQTSAFRNNELTQIVIPESVRRIAENAFVDNALISITIGADVELERNSIGNYFVTQYSTAGWGFGQAAGTYVLARDGWTWVRQE